MEEELPLSIPSAIFSLCVAILLCSPGVALSCLCPKINWSCGVFVGEICDTQVGSGQSKEQVVFFWNFTHQRLKDFGRTALRKSSAA